MKNLEKSEAVLGAQIAAGELFQNEFWQDVEAELDRNKKDAPKVEPRLTKED